MNLCKVPVGQVHNECQLLLVIHGTVHLNTAGAPGCASMCIDIYTKVRNGLHHQNNENGVLTNVENKLLYGCEGVCLDMSIDA